MHKGKFYFQWHITNMCNLKCLHCYQERFDSKEDCKEYVLLKIADKIFTFLAKYNFSSEITLTGGEPLLKKEIYRLLNLFEENELVTSVDIVTNGTLLNLDVIEKLKKYCKLRYVKVSLDGGLPSINDNIRGKNIFNIVIEKIKLLKEANFNVIVMFTVMKMNKHTIGEVIDMAKEMGIKGVVFEKFVPIGNGGRLQNEVLSAKEMLEVYNYILSYAGLQTEPEELVKYRGLWVKFSSSSGEDSSCKIEEVRGGLCSAGDNSLCILADGRLLPCRRFFLPIGDLSVPEVSLEEVWFNSEVIKNIRDRNMLKGSCGKCTIENCYGCRAIAYVLYNDYLAEDPQCWLCN